MKRARLKRRPIGRHGRRLVAWLAVPTLAACAPAPGDGERHKDEGPTFYGDTGDDPLDPPRSPDFVDDEDPFLFRRPSPVDAGAQEGGIPLCPTPVQAGDLKIVELMVATISGSGDRGEWIEVESTRNCRLNIRGVAVSSPRGASIDVAAVTSDTIVEPYGHVVFADSALPAENNGLIGVVASFDAADVLKNSGDTVMVKVGDIVIDAVAYPSFGEVGASLAFPASCAPADRSNFARWQASTKAYAGLLKGTPAKPNDDVTCP